MIVLGSECFIFESTCKIFNVETFSTDLGNAQDIPIVDAALVYNHLLTNKTYILIICNALHIESMTLIFISPFTMREGGITVNDIPKLYCVDPTINDQCIYFKDTKLRISLQLNCVLSYVNTRNPPPSELYDKYRIFITPNAIEWDPNCLSY